MSVLPHVVWKGTPKTQTWFLSVHVPSPSLHLAEATSLCFPIKSLSHLPGTCKPKEGTNCSSGSPACKTLACPPSNFRYTTWKETQRNNLTCQTQSQSSYSPSLRNFTSS
ncbi:hypothetical protein ATANTOWER_027368 [Ataeniobius toweri]|uniref:Uncharacterized protein n=1 Tax=Ataeniobius toweri TaxID=208326 RepID=A0ABU7AKF0_9TELE|nr:hypothetical protein [Ataeniobius toweri]